LQGCFVAPLVSAVGFCFFPENHVKKHARSTLKNTLGDGGYVNCGHRLGHHNHPIKETKMFTVLSNTRNSNLYIAAALAMAIAVLLVLFAVPAISAPRASLVPVTSLSQAGSDYYQRHSELRPASPSPASVTADFYLRHRDWTLAPVTLNAVASDYFQRHPELRTPAGSTDLSDFFQRH
jgi:hypothetical protein